MIPSEVIRWLQQPMVWLGSTGLLLAIVLVLVRVQSRKPSRTLRIVLGLLALWIAWFLYVTNGALMGWGSAVGLPAVSEPTTLYGTYLGVLGIYAAVRAAGMSAVLVYFLLGVLLGAELFAIWLMSEMG